MKNLVNYLDEYVNEEETSNIKHKTKNHTKHKFNEDLENIYNYVKKNKKRK